MVEYNAYNLVFTSNAMESEHCDAQAEDYARGMVWSEVDLQLQSIAYGRFVSTVDGVDIYYDFGADYYFFCPDED